MKIFGVKIYKLNYDFFFKEITKFDKQNIVFTPNPEILLETKSDEEFKNILEKANFLTPDGIGLYLAAQILNNNHGKFMNTLLLPYFIFNLIFRKKYLYEKFGERITGSSLTKDLLDFSQEKNISITILDLYNPNDKKKVESQAIFEEKLQKVFPNLKFNYIIFNPEKKSEIFENIKNSDSKIVFSTLGMKRQEKSIIEVMEYCKNIKLGLGIGSSFDYFIGFQKRAPKVWRDIGLEWLYRIITGPQKLKRIKRIYRAILKFSFEVIKEK